MLISELYFDLVRLLLIIFAIRHFHPGKEMVFNVNDLKDWIKKEKAMGCSPYV